MGSLNCGCATEEPNPIISEYEGEKNSSESKNSTIPGITKLSTLIKSESLNPHVLSLWNKLGPYSYPEYNNEEVAQWQKILLNEGTFIGECIENLPNGKGFIILNDGSLIETIWKTGKMHGKGRMTYSNEAVFVGPFADGVISGNGSLVHKNGRKFEGFWVNGKEEGFGKEIFADRSEFCGEYKQGKKTGKGIFKWVDGSKYEGQFFDDKFHGKGVYVWKTGKKYDGDWVEGKMHGKGNLFWPDGRKYFGEFCMDLKHGTGKYFWADGKVFIGGWAHDKMHGIGVICIHSKQIQLRGEWKNGIRVRWITWDLFVFYYNNSKICFN